MHISFDPSPNYEGIAKAAAGNSFGQLAGNMYTARASTADDLKSVIAQAVIEVKAGRGAVVNAVMREEVENEK